jgi:hypothetical protein
MEANPPGGIPEMVKDVLLIPSCCWTFDVNDKLQECVYDLSGYTEGQTLKIFAAAPGCGSTIYKVTRVTNEGVFARFVSTNVRELTPSEVV